MTRTTTTTRPDGKARITTPTTEGSMTTKTPEHVLAEIERNESVITNIETIPVKDLHVDVSRYQREVDQDRLDKMRRNFDPRLFDPITVSLREDGTYWVIDGHHRVELAKYKRLTAIACRVLYGLSVEQEAELFTAFAKGRKAISTYDQLRAGVAAGDPDATAIMRATRAAGFEVVAHSAYLPKTFPEHDGDRYPVKATSKLIQLYKLARGGARGAGFVEEALRMVRSAWPTTDQAEVAVQTEIIGGVGRILIEFDTEVDRDRLLTTLSDSTPKDVKTKGRTKASSINTRPDIGVALHLVEQYNRFLRSSKKRLDPARLLYTKPYVGK